MNRYDAMFTFDRGMHKLVGDIFDRAYRQGLIEAADEAARRVGNETTNWTGEGADACRQCVAVVGEYQRELHDLPDIEREEWPR